ncbi:MAG: hypothetical protein Q4D65_07235 [Peptostreptococcaceae bacterium]|nr:hypothetical protein [Peptostreptococcaceae bacterium]
MKGREEIAEKYSVRLLKECVVLENKNLEEDSKIFEEVTVLCTLPSNFLEDSSYSDILSYFQKHLAEIPYVNAYDELIENRVVAVIDYYIHVMDVIEFPEFEEVFSRHFLEEPCTKFKDVLEKYYPDFYLAMGML